MERDSKGSLLMSRQQHVDRLELSKPDHIGLTRSVQEKVQELCGAYQRIRGEPLKFPSFLKEDVSRFRVLLDRYQAGDFRHKQSEIESVKLIAEWSLQVNSAIRNQGPVEVPEWAI